MNSTTANKIILFRKIYYILGGICAVGVLLVIGFLVNDNLAKNTKAQLFISNSKKIETVIVDQNETIQLLGQRLGKRLPKHFVQLQNSEVNLNQLTKYFDEIETKLKEKGLFTINGIGYKESEKLEIDFRVTTNKANFLELLKILTESGLSQNSPYMFQVDSFNFSLIPDQDVHDLSINFNLKLLNG